MTPLSTSLVGGALGAGIGLLCGCPDRAFKYGIVGLLAGGLVGKLASKGTTTTIAGADPDWWRDALANNPYGHSLHMRALAERERREGFLPGGDDPYIESLPGQGLKPDFEVVRHDGAVLDGATGRITGRIRPGMPFEPGPLENNARHRRHLQWRPSLPRMLDCPGEIVTGFQCPEGFDLVSSDHQIACAYRGQSACLAGTTDASGQFICTSRDFDCPPGMFTRKGAPANWCFPA